MYLDDIIFKCFKKVYKFVPTKSSSTVKPKFTQSNLYFHYRIEDLITPHY